MQVLVTGANRGIGAALVTELSARGHSVIGTSRDGRAGFPLDVTDAAQIAALADHLRDRPLDLLVCNAGVYLDRHENLDDGYAPDLWARTFATNVTGVFSTVQAALPALRSAGGKIAIISSQMGSSERARGGAYIYRASKAAVTNLGRNLATDLAGEGIAVGIYHPGWVRTDMGSSAADISVEQSATGLATRFDALSMDTTGCFEFYDGRACPF
ncbi:SDR family NAD(P)-dependent oxidoreductase [Pseudaestuariivita atlantica]|uniref:Short-chain dehydrogenase n=1 Tax=Pseudaestuariivita atlantica TaxID=1317121 RepID=A0A0L1JTV1_9RHOB|nr:SDR family NAD(P)-dependent oxidoreductase [Pseudaestuariivita atlantica]KNG94838.1 short-chain dehydrogenase [Pseudaestuariivita atlantica]